MKDIIIALIIGLFIKSIFCSISCPESHDPPQNIEIDTSKNINPIYFNESTYSSINVGNKIFLTKNTHEGFGSITSGYFDNKDYCPDDFIIPFQTDFEEMIKNLGSNAYNILTDKNGFNMTKGEYYLTNTIGSATFQKLLLYIDEDNSLKYIDIKPYSVKAVVRCMLKIPQAKLISPLAYRDLDYNEKIDINIDDKYLNGYLWKVDDDTFTTQNITYTFSKRKEYTVQFWGKYINGSDVYFCEIAYVNKKDFPSSQTFDDSQIKIIETNFSMLYDPTLTFVHSNNPIAPRDNGGYYVAYTATNKNIHILYYDKNDNLVKDFEPNLKAYPYDITATDYGFAIYLRSIEYSNYSYINLYDKEYNLIKSVTIMNNGKNDNHLKDSNLNKQIIKYEYNGEPTFGMRFMYDPDNGKLIYSRNRIFLIFCHYNYFLDVKGHTGDTIVTFNDSLLDMDFGQTWGASHSLIQSVTYDKNYFWTAALSDAYPEGIEVQYTSKRNFTWEYDPVNKKYNTRQNGANSDLAGYIKGYHTGPADGKLGGILYFEKYDLYYLVYAKTPNYSEDAQKNGKNIIFISTWKFENNKITNNKTYEIKVFNTGNVMQLRAGKYGDDTIIIIYAETDKEGNHGYGNLQKGTPAKVFVINASDMKIVINDKSYDNLLVNTNEDLRTFKDGVLIWGATNKDGKLTIHKIGTPKLDDNYENNIFTGDDIGKNDNNSRIISGIYILFILYLILSLELNL